MSSIPLPDPTQVPDPAQPAPQPGGRVRSLLSNFFQGAGSAMMHQVGMPTPQEQAQQAFKNQIAQKEFESEQALRQAQIEGLKSEMQPVQLPGMPPIAAKHAAAVMGAFLASQSRQNVAEDTNKTRLTIAELIAKSKVASPPKPGSIEQQLLDAISSDDVDKIRQISQVVDVTRTQPGIRRAAAFGANRPGAYIDPEGNLIADYSGHAIAQGYTPAAPGAKAMSAQAQFGEIRTGSAALRNAITKLDRDFSPDQRAKLSLAMRAPDESVLHTIINSMLGTEQLTPAQQDYVISATQMHERVLGLRQMAGMGQGSESTRIALQATVPNVNMADKAYGLKQLDAVDQQVESLYQGVPKVKSFNRGGGGSTIPYRFPDGSVRNIRPDQVQRAEALHATRQ